MRHRTVLIAVLALLVAAPAILGADTYEAALKESRALYRSRKYEEAIQAARKAADLAKSPTEKATAIIHAGECLIRARKSPEAAKTFQEVLGLEGAAPNQKALAQCRYAYAVERQGRKMRQAGIAAYEKVLTMPGAEQYYKGVAQIRIAWLNYYDKKYDKAQAAAQWIVDQPKSRTDRKAEAYEILCAILCAQKKAAEAVSLMEKGLALPKLSKYWKARLQYDLGVYLDRAGKPDEAVAAFGKIANDEKGYSYWRERCYLETARIEMKRKDYAKAKAACDALIALPKANKRNVKTANRYLEQITKAAGGK